jgi:tRNA(adenine34) deaminase
MDELYMRKALDMANRGFKRNDVPVGCVIVKDGKVIAKAYNTKNIKNCSINHAEILAIKKACKKLGTWHLDDCTLYVTMEPCLMCCGAILQARIGRVVYGTKCAKFGYVHSISEVLNSKKNNHQVSVTGGVLEDECSKILKKFFSNKRD